MLKILKLEKDEDGGGLIICIFVLFFMFSVGGLVVDCSILYKTKGEMKKAANAAVLSGAQVMLKDEDSVNNVVQYVLEAHNEQYSTPSIEGDKLTVILDKDVPLDFMKIFHVNSAPIEVKSSAKIGPLGGASGVVPIGVPQDSNFVIGEEYPLNYNPGNANQGNYEYFDFSNIVTPSGDTVVDSSISATPGAGTLDYYIENGFNPEIKVNYDIATKTGVNLGPVRTAINNRITSLNPDDRILLVLLYDPADFYSANGKKYINITGFASFYLESFIGTEIRGKFIDYVQTGSIDDSAKYRGTDGVKLVE